MRDTDTVPRDPRGFTLLELMIIVAIVGILAAVVIPSWVSTSRNRKYDPEISAMFTELSTREEQYKSEVGNGLYLIAATCPATPAPAGVDFNSTCGIAAPWTTLRVVATDSLIRCTYGITVGAPASVPAPPAPCAAAPASLAGSWYYIIATCDMDGAGGTNATFCTASWDQKQRSLNYGL